VSNESLSPKPLRRQTLAERMAEDIADRILSGDLKPRDSLPAGPELAQQYGVSRAVVRDATNLLAARGLVDVRHGSGVYVTASQRAAFGDALVLTLQRAGATAWDLEQFEELLFPAAAALVCATASDKEIAEIRALAQRHLAELEAWVDTAEDGERVDEDVLPFAHVLQAIFDATHNEVIRQIGAQLTALRRPRNWVGVSARGGYEMDRAFLEELLSILESRDPMMARERIENLMELPPEAIDAMKQTPIGDVPRIDIG
jgi:DNA-binding FadR family transcriptional regulator